jgi:hypothetical protein
VPLNFLKPERGGFDRATKEGGFENIYQFEKTVVLKMYHKTT